MNIRFLLIVIWNLHIISFDLGVLSASRQFGSFRYWSLRRRYLPPMETLTTSLLVNFDESISQCGPYEIDIRELTIDQIQEYFEMGKLTSVDLTQCYLNRISKIDVYLKSVIEINPEAISLAIRADKERCEGKNQSQLHGIPILIKDNIGTFDHMQTTAGAVALEKVKPKNDADVVKRLRNAGAIILGKTNLSEWANFRGNKIPGGWSGRGGQTKCPYVLEQDPSGSSTGSAVSISANLAVISLGTETDGSIISPSTTNGVVGLKPTIGAVSTVGVIPLSFSNDVVGPIARTVADAAKVMGVISDVDLQGCDCDVSSCLSQHDFKIGVLRDPFWNESDVTLITAFSSLEAILDNLKESGLANVTDPVVGDFEALIAFENELIVFGHEFKFSINNYLKSDVDHMEWTIGRSIHSLADIIQYNEVNPSKEGYNQDTMKTADRTDGLQNETYLATREVMRMNSIKYLESIFDKSRVDALLTPSFSTDITELFPYGAFAGYPSITVPIGIDETGMPFALYLLGRPYSEPVLLKLGYFLEFSRSNKRPVPRFSTKSSDGK